MSIFFPTTLYIGLGSTTGAKRSTSTVVSRETRFAEVLLTVKNTDRYSKDGSNVLEILDTAGRRCCCWNFTGVH